MGNRADLRKQLSSGEMVVAPFVLNALHARIAESIGFSAVYMTGSGTSAERGFPDVGLLTMSEMVANGRYIAQAVDIPLIADCDTGYGNALNVRRAVREYEAAGVAGIHVEDQVFPKKCGFFDGKKVIPREEMVQKIHAALDARQDPDFVIIARCDAYAVMGWDEATSRCRSYMDAGADMVFVDGIRDRDDLERYARDLEDLPRLYNGDLLPTHEVANMGFKLMICGSTIWLVYKAVMDAFAELRATGQVDPNRYGTRMQVADLLGLPEVYELERQYSVSEVAPRNA